MISMVDLPGLDDDLLDLLEDDVGEREVAGEGNPVDTP